MAKAWVVLCILALSFIAGAAGQYFYPFMNFPPTDIWMILFFAILLFLWYRIDSEQRSYKRSPWLSSCILGIPILGLPYYLFRSRGFKGGLVACVVMLLVSALSVVLMVAGQYAVYYGQQS